MARRRFMSPPEPPAPAGALPEPPAASPARTAAVVLVVEAVSAVGKKCPAGTVIAPDVEGWPPHRVQAHLRNGQAVERVADGL